MALVSFLYALVLFTSTILASKIPDVDYHIQHVIGENDMDSEPSFNTTQIYLDDSCTDAYPNDAARALGEFIVAVEMATTAAKIFAMKDTYGTAFMPKQWRDGPNIGVKTTYARSYLTRMARAATPGKFDDRQRPIKDLKVSCLDDEKDPATGDLACKPLGFVVAYTEPEANRINLCPTFFDPQRLWASQIVCKDGTDLQAYESKGMLFLGQQGHCRSKSRDLSEANMFLTC